MKNNHFLSQQHCYTTWATAARATDCGYVPGTPIC